MDAPKSEEGGCGGLRSALSSATVDFLVSPSGEKSHQVVENAQVSLSELEGKVVGLYFSANWCFKCENFTSVLATAYNKLKEQGSNFEVVLVSCDEDRLSFEQFHATMYWPAIPFSNVQSKKNLSERFRIEEIPSLIILNPRGDPINIDGVELVCRYGDRAFPFTLERIKELEAEDKAKHDSQTLINLLSISGEKYVIGHGVQISISNLVGKTVGLYFSSHQCSPCTKFTSRLSSVYKILKEKDEQFEIVFISMDKNEADFSECFNFMPWLASPFDEKAAQLLARYFNVQGIPSLIVIGPDGKTVTEEGRNLVNLHLENAYPFTASQLQLLKKKMDEEAKSYPSSFNHAGHRHLLKLVSGSTGGGPYICCECDEQGSGWAYQCINCGYEIHLKCAKGIELECDNSGKQELVAMDLSDCSSSGV